MIEHRKVQCSRSRTEPRKAEECGGRYARQREDQIVKREV